MLPEMLRILENISGIGYASTSQSSFYRQHRPVHKKALVEADPTTKIKSKKGGRNLANRRLFERD